ncbi:uncharacterized protein LOC133735796 [Rosa rugosa]|uniref:uncharacterized protein LOC133735796 n=1 Tax=Rosa rugosa TaxID=74645 RepID=UPI002B4040A9|nr:uncharacterized protein LOC133735796 [Rosa rugosa]
MCCDCQTDTSGVGHRYHCQSCGQWICGKCIQGGEWDGLTSSDEVGEKFCKFCSEVRLRRECGRKCSEKVHPSASPEESPEPPSPCFSSETIRCGADDESTRTDHLSKYLEAQDIGYSPRAVKSMTSFSSYPSPVAVHCSHSRSDEEEAEDLAKNFCSPSSEYCDDNLDIDLNSVSARSELYSLRSLGSSQFDCSSRIYYTSSKGHSVQQRHEGIPATQSDESFGRQTKAVLKRPGREGGEREEKA